MWVKILKTYAGPLSLYVIDQKLDVPKEIVDKLPKCTCKPVPAPWDEKIDHKAIAAAEAKKNAGLAIEKAVALRQKVDEFALNLADLVKVFKEAQNVADKARELVDKTNQKKPDTDKAKKHLAGLRREFQFADARLQIAGSRFAIAQAEKTIAILETEDAEKLAAKLADEAGLEFGPAKKVPDAGG